MLLKQPLLLSSAVLASTIVIVAVAPVNATVIPVTGVQLNRLAEGLEIRLQTPSGQELKVFTTSYNQTLVADVVNAELRLPDGKSFQAENPASGITSVTVTPGSNNSVRITVRGEKNLPTVQVVPGTPGLLLSVGVPGTGASVTPKAKPESKPSVETAPQLERKQTPTTQTEKPVAESQEEINVVVTATRTEEDPQNVPRSVTVITREEIETQSAVSRNVGDILGQLVPGFGPPSQSASIAAQSLRGRQPSILIDGVPINVNRRSFQELRSIDPSAIERIEVVRGPSAIYGAEATGGIINIITRSPEKQFTSFAEVGVTGSLVHPEESFGNLIQYGISGTEGQVDYNITLSRESTGEFYDAEGDRIPVTRAQGLDNLETINALAKVGINFSEEQRLQLSVNHFRDLQDTDILSDPRVDLIAERTKARALEIDELEIDDLPGRINTVANLNYSHDNIFGSRVQTQAYYLEYSARTVPSDSRNDPFFNSVSQSVLDSKKWGGRLQIETPLFQAANILWGVDYVNETTSQPLNVFDPALFDATGGNEFRQIDQVFWVPPYDLESIGLFAQLQWDVSDRLSLSGGARYEDIGLSVDDYTVLDGRNITGGKRAFNDTVFNVGAIYALTDEVSIFANFAQGFSVPDLGRILRRPPRGFIGVESSLQITDPQKVDNYEIGVKGNWDNIQASLAGFYSYSSLGATVRGTVGDFLELVRAPQRVYGVEASVDAQLSNTWEIGGIASWTEGENDEDEDGDYLPLSSREIQPLKLGTYIQNETLPGWTNRLQALYIGSRDRAFEQEVDDVPINDYITVDYISRLRLGSGTLQLGIQNIFNQQYFPVDAQVNALNSLYTAAQGTTFRLSYSLTW